MRKPFFCICEIKAADQLCGNSIADKRLCFRYIDSTIPLLPKSEISKPLAIFCGCTARFVSDLVEKPKDRFSCVMAHMKIWEKLSFAYHQILSNSGLQIVCHDILLSLPDNFYKDVPATVPHRLYKP